MCQLGNERCNHVYENKVPDDMEKPNPGSDRETREQWITAKYKTKVFVPQLSADSHLNKV